MDIFMKYKIRMKGSLRWWTAQPVHSNLTALTGWMDESFVTGVEFLIYSSTDEYVTRHTTVNPPMPGYFTKALS